MPDPKKPVDASKIPVRPTEPTEPQTPTEGIVDAPLAADLDGQIGTRLAGVAWRARMRWLDDGGR
jgi:hypothetical protein